LFKNSSKLSAGGNGTIWNGCRKRKGGVENGIGIRQNRVEKKIIVNIDKYIIKA